MNIKNLAVGIGILLVVLIFGFIGSLIDVRMQEQAIMQDYYELEMEKAQSSFPESAYHGLDSYDPGQYPESENVGAKVGAKVDAGIGAKMGASVTNTVSQEFPTSSSESTPEIGQKLIKNSRLDFDVEDYDEAYDKVYMIAANAGGYVSDSKDVIYTTEEHKRKGGYVVIRIPADKFDSVISQIETIGDLTAKDINVEDVTQKYIDLSSRLRNAKAEEERFLKIMENATTVEDMLMVEKEIGRVRDNIEQMQGQMNYMTNRIDLATIDINMQEPEREKPYKPQEHEWGIREAVDTSINGFVSTTRGLIIIFGYLLPIFIVFGVVYLIYKKLRSKGKKKKDCNERKDGLKQKKHE